MYILIAFLILAVIPLSVIVNGYVLTVLFKWFLVPLGLAPISIPTAIGIAMIVSYLTYKIDTNKPEKTLNDALADLGAAIVVKPLAALAGGYIVTLFM